MATVTRLDGRHLLSSRALPFIDALRVADREGKSLPTLEDISELLNIRRDLDDRLSRTAAFYITRTVVCSLSAGETFVSGMSVQDGRNSYRMLTGGVPVLDGESVPVDLVGRGGGAYFEAVLGDLHVYGRRLVFSPEKERVKPIGPLPDRDGWTTNLPGPGGHYFRTGNDNRRVGPIVVGVGALERHVVFIASLPDIMSYGVLFTEK